jgi:hypothetical protein
MSNDQKIECASEAAKHLNKILMSETNMPMHDTIG